jgi:hypothetical protein
MVPATTRGSAPAEPPAPITEPAAGDPGAEDPELLRARELYEEGEARFATADYFAAIELWTKAFTSVPDTADSARIQAALIYNIATAREKAFEVSGDLTHLRQAKLLMEDYAASIPALYGDGPEADAERGRITGRLNIIVRRIEEVEREREKSRPDRGPDRSDDRAAAKRSRAMIASGSTFLVLGAGALGMMTGGLVMGANANDISDIEEDDIDQRREQFDKGRTGNALAISGGVLGGVFALTGAVLVGLGATQRPRNVAVAPSFGPRSVALSLSAKF